MGRPPYTGRQCGGAEPGLRQEQDIQRNDATWYPERSRKDNWVFPPHPRCAGCYLCAPHLSGVGPQKLCPHLPSAVSIVASV